jgi:putative transposase
MKKSKFSDSQIMAILKQAEAGIPVPELCREHGMSNATFYKCKVDPTVKTIIDRI